MSDREARAEVTFYETLERPAQERDAFLSQSCGGDESLQQHVRRLLAAHEAAGNYLDPLDSPEIEAELIRLKPEEAGDRVGSYKLLEQLGEGGFGTVWVAEQERPVRRRVALKVIKLGMDTREVVARFEQERQALAMMDHPNIAKVFDAGSTPTGRPYFVMELVRGVKVTEYCDEHELSTRERIELFMDICHAVQHAHQKGIIHRDLKPSNILVTINDGAAVPKVIDFGVAKATQGRLTEETVYTQFQQMMGTPIYMSPEQAEMTSLDIDTRSDVYSLGVLLYELLTGRTPIEQKTLMEAGIDEVRRVIREVDPPRPSMRVRMLGGSELTTTAKRRRVDPVKLRSQLKGDLDWIVMKCLEKDRRRRYDTVNGVALDLRRHLGNEIIAARPRTTWYAISRVVRRNRLTFAMGSGIVILLVAGVTISICLAIRAKQAEVRANLSRSESEAALHFITNDLLLQANPDQNAREQQVTLEQALDRFAHKLEDDPEFAAHPTVEATLRLAMGNAYYSLGFHDKAERHLRRAVTLRRNALGAAHRDTLTAQESFARFLVIGAQKFPEAEKISRETLEAMERLHGEDDPSTLESMRTYAYSLVNLGRFAEAEALQRKVLAACERRFGPDHFDTINALGDAAMISLQQGNVDEYTRLTREEFARFQRIGALNREEALYSANNLAVSYLLLGETETAREIISSAIKRAIPIYGEENRITSHLRHNLARAWENEGRLDEAEKVSRLALEIRTKLESGQESNARSLFLLGRILVQGGKFEEAEPLLIQARTLFEEVASKKPGLRRQAEHWIGAVKLAQKAYAAAERLLILPDDPMFGSSGLLTRSEKAAAIRNIVELYELTGRAELAEKWKQKLGESD